MYLCHHRDLYQLAVVSSPIPDKYVHRTSITSACIHVNVLASPLTHVTSIISACIISIALASMICAHRAKTPNLVNHAKNYLTRASLQLDEKRGKV